MRGLSSCSFLQHVCLSPGARFLMCFVHLLTCSYIMNTPQILWQWRLQQFFIKLSWPYLNPSIFWHMSWTDQCDQWWQGCIFNLSFKLKAYCFMKCLHSFIKIHSPARGIGLWQASPAIPWSGKLARKRHWESAQTFYHYDIINLISIISHIFYPKQKVLCYTCFVKRQI